MNYRSISIALAALVAVSGPAYAGEWDVTGFVGIDSRTFWQDPVSNEQTSTIDASLILQPEFYWRSDSGDQRISIVGFGRADLEDAERNHADLREAYWGIDKGSWDFNIGLNKVFWGVTESRHLVDVINQTDLVEDIDGEAKLGQPSMSSTRSFPLVYTMASTCGPRPRPSSIPSSAETATRTAPSRSLIR